MKTILVVDDREEIRDLIRMTLASDDHQIMFAENGEKAIENTRMFNPDLILMDIIMPGIGGLEATRRIKTDKSTRGSIVILLTARGQKKDIEEGLQVGADDYVVKPFSPLRLVQMIRRYLGE